MAAPVALAAPPARIPPDRRVDMKVLLLSADGTQPGFGAWKAALEREGIPYEAYQAYTGQTRTGAPITDAKLADYGANHAKYDAIILETGDLGHTVDNPGGTTSFLSALSDAEWAALAKFERTFGIRRLSDATFPAPLHGLNPVGTAGPQDGSVGTLTATGKLAFPYLKGPIPIANDDPATAETFGVAGTPVSADTWQTLVAAPGGGAYLGVYTHPDDGREEMVMTVNGNQFQSHNQLLRHGMLNWVTRGVFLGYQRNYLSLDVDDVLLPDDKWDAANNVTVYDPDQAIRMSPQDVTNAVAWQRRTGLRLNMVYNMGGLTEFPTGAPELLAALRANRNEFRWVNHTLQHPNLDCSTAGYIASQLTQNQAVFDAQLGGAGLAAGLNDPSEAVTGEHSGLANTRPGNPGTIDPPAFEEAAPGTGGALAAGTYEYGVTASTAAGETPASTTDVTVAASGSATLRWPSVCHATSYNVYRRIGTAGAWSRLATVPVLPAGSAFTDAGATLVSYTDAGAAGSASAPPAANNASLAPYAQNPGFVDALTRAGVRSVAGDASKAYPDPPTGPVTATTQFPAGATFTDGPAQVVPRYPSNVYYNVANRADQLDEYNWIYVSPPAGGCVPITGVTTCRTTPATWAEYLTSETNIMFRHLMDNDPRPHYFHQTNIAQSSATAPPTDTTVGGTLYAVMDTLLARYDAGIDRSVAPLVGLSQSEAAATLSRQAAWRANLAAGRVSAWLQDGVLHVKNTSASPIDVPLTGTTVGESYAGQKSGWTTLGAGAEQAYSPADPAVTGAPAVTGTARVGNTLRAGNGTWAGTAPIDFGYQWQRCNAQGSACANIPGAGNATYVVTTADVGRSLRVVVQAGNWVSSVSQAASPPAGAMARRNDPPGGSPDTGRNGGHRGGSGGGRQGGSGGGGALRLTNLKMKPRRFAVSHRKRRKGTRLDGSVITWRLNRAATVRLTVQRKRGDRWVRVGRLTRTGKKGTGVVRFRGRFGRRLLAPRSYRLVVVASTSDRRSRAKRVTFRVVRG